MKSMYELPTEFIILGAGGHALVLKALANAAGMSVVGVSDPRLHVADVAQWQGLPVFSDDGILEQEDSEKIGLLNGIGQLPRCKARKNIQLKFMVAGFYFPPCVHPSAWVCDDAKLGEGCQIMAGAIVQPGCEIGIGSIINTKASIDHDCTIGDHVHIAPGATLCGNITAGEGAFIASGAVVIQNINIGCDSILGAGATLVNDLKDRTCFIGVNNLK